MIKEQTWNGTPEEGSSAAREFPKRLLTNINDIAKSVPYRNAGIQIYFAIGNKFSLQPSNGRV